MNEAIRIILVDDHPLFREGVVKTLASAQSFQIVGQADNREKAIELATEQLPDILLLDIGIPGGGIATAQIIASLCPATRIVMLTVSEDEEHLMAAIKAGARAYILKGVSGRELIQILQGVASGDVFIPSTLASDMLIEMEKSPQEPYLQTDPTYRLTSREHQILELVAIGSSNKEIGERLFISEKTVKHYMTNILQKLQVRNRVEAALIAQRTRFTRKSS